MSLIEQELVHVLVGMEVLEKKLARLLTVVTV